MDDVTPIPGSRRQSGRDPRHLKLVLQQRWLYQFYDRELRLGDECVARAGWHRGAQVAQFKKINGTVIWRPFAEFNGTGHFGSQFTPAQFQQFWIYTYNYMHAQGVNNVLYAFDLNDWDRQNNTAACGNAFCTGANWYPGNAYVDLTAMDSYPPGENGTTYDTVMYNYFVSTGKPFFFFEAGVSGNPGVNSGNNDTGVLNVVKSEFPKAFAVVIWCQQWALDSQNGESAVMTDPAIVTLSDVPAAFANGSGTP
jgi:beta-mannanase